MSFPEEPLNLSVTEGGGYYPATIHQTLKGSTYEIVRKLGYGPRSSVWLVLDVRDNVYFAVKIFTAAASEQLKHQESFSLPQFRKRFWEKSGQGDHLCIVLDPLSTSVQDLLQQSKDQRLPVHVVQWVVRKVAEALEGLHGRPNIMHGAVKADNILFEISTQTEYLKRVLDSEPAPTTLKVKNYTTVRSQPLRHNFKWNGDEREVTSQSITLCNFGHAQRGYKPEKNGDYLSAPETLLQDASCSCQTDIWMLGAMTFYLLTGSSFFFAKGNPSKQISTLRAILEDELPKEWLSDKKMKDFNPDAHGYVNSIDASLVELLPQPDVAPAAAFIKACLRLDPKKRLSATEANNHQWLKKILTCSCSFCVSRA